MVMAIRFLARPFFPFLGYDQRKPIQRREQQLRLQHSIDTVHIARIVRKVKPMQCRAKNTSSSEVFTERANTIIKLAEEEARRLGLSYVGTEHIIVGIIEEESGIGGKILKSMGVDSEKARTVMESFAIAIGEVESVDAHIPLHSEAKLALEQSVEEANALGHDYVDSEHIFLALLSQPGSIAMAVIYALGLNPNIVREEVLSMISGKESNKISLSILEKYGRNLTKLGEEGKLAPTIGRQPQMERIVQILGRLTKNNACLIGERGVGKTAIAEGIAKYIVNENVPQSIRGKKVIALDTDFLVTETQGTRQFEDILKRILVEMKQIDAILFIDDMHILFGAGANILKLALARAELQCIGATTLDKYKQLMEADTIGLERRFQPVEIHEPTVEETVQILKGMRKRYEIHHQLRYTDESLVAAAQLAYQYISNGFLPDKAIDLIDEAGSRVRLLHARLMAGSLLDRKLEVGNEISEEDLLVTEADIEHIIFSWTGIPVAKVSTDESDRLLEMEEALLKRVIGQDEAVKAISRAIRRARVGLKNPNRPIASFIFSGPTGVGKSELAKALAAYYFGSEEAMIRLDMSEFMERHTVSKLIGSPPGYIGYTEGGQLTEAVLRRPYTMILFDEIEKAHPDVFNMMLQILEDGRLTDGKGKTVDFRNTLLIMTSNVGSSVIEKGGRHFGFDLDYDEKESSYKSIKSLVTEELKHYFKPEFLNRLDEMIVFRQLTKLEVKEIADILLKEVFERLKKKKIELQVTERFKERVLGEGYNPSYGARPLRRAIMGLLEDSMAEKMLAREIKEGDSVIVDVDSDGKVTVSKKTQF